MSFLDLSVELLQEVTYRIPAEHKQLRAVCKSLNFAVAPSFFSSLCFDIHSARLEPVLSHLEGLAAGTSPWSQYARKLTIKRLTPSLAVHGEDKGDPHELQQAEARLKQFLRPAFESLKNVRTVLWTFSSGTEESKWTTQTVHSFLGSLPLDDFRLTADEASLNDFDCSFDRLIGLQKLTLSSSNAMTLKRISQSLSHTIRNSPEISYLSLESTSSGSPFLYNIADLFHGLSQPLRLTELRLSQCNMRLDRGTIPYLHSLQSLWLFGEDSTTWDCLRKEGIHLTELRTDIVADELIEYLSSYSGLEMLVIRAGWREEAEESNRLADRFFGSGLPPHAHSLTTLSCYGTWEGRWSFGPHNAGVLSQLCKLTSLRMRVNSVFLKAPRPPQNPGGGSSRGRSEIIQVENDEDDRSMVHRFLDLLGQLPTVVDGAILPSLPERYRGAKCGHNYMKHKHAMINAIDVAIRQFQSQPGACASKAVVLAGRNYYKGVEEGEKDRYRVVESVNLPWPYSYDRLLEESS
ncbi:hypothetical protein K438DRAFT_2025199 [Mycena galopus ATCC 62051]|nr:hypothetical protein K438DRAFT_2025199 [Mycena galopus ATCC 62051]